MILKVEELSFSYNSHPLLEGVSFRVERGRIVGILGVNGAGKSTLLKCLNRILKPGKGAILLDGRELAHLKRNEVARTLGYVPQKPEEEPFTVFDALLVGRKPHVRFNVGERDYRIVERVITTLGLESLALRPVALLSGGERQKVLLGRALVQEPEILLLDEPTSNLDPRNQLEVMNLVKKAVVNEGLSAVVSLHDLNLALRFADHILVLKEGRIHSETQPGDLTPSIIRETYGIEVEMATVAGYRIVVPVGTADSERN